MANPSLQSGIRDNHYCGSVGDFLKLHIGTGSKMAVVYTGLLEKAVQSIAATFRKRIAAGLQTGRGFKIPDRKDQADATTDFELVTWLVIKEES